MKKKIAVLLAFVMVIGLCVTGIAKKSYAREAQMYIEFPELIKKEQEMKVKVVLDSDVNLYSIDAYVEYDPTILEFVPENDIVTGADGLLEIQDVFGEETKQKEYEITFRTLEVGSAYVNLTDVYLIDYEDLDYITVPPSDYSFEIGINENVAEDARLSDLIVAPGDLTESFHPNKLNYEMHIGMDVETVGISAFAMDEDSVVDVDMPEKFMEGENTIKITVTALSGNINIYTIKVIKADWQEDADEEATTQEQDESLQPEEETTGTDGITATTESSVTEETTENTTEVPVETTTEADWDNTEEAVTE